MRDLEVEHFNDGLYNLNRTDRQISPGSDRGPIHDQVRQPVHTKNHVPAKYQLRLQAAQSPSRQNSLNKVRE